MNIIKHAEGVYEIEDFLTQDQQEMLLSSAQGDGWVNSHPGNTTKNLSDDVFENSKEISALVESFFDNFVKIFPIANIRRLTDGEFMHLHKDEGSPSNPEPIVFGIAIYLNDDFVGGELSYPDLNLVVKTKPRSMVVHNAKYSHEVLPVTSGSRYSITTFVLGDGSTKFNGHS